MPRQTRAAIINELNKSIDEELPFRLLYTLLASATNADGTAFALPVDTAFVAALVPRGYQQPVVPVTATAITPLVPPAGATRVTIIPSVAIRWRDDGVAPTSTVGMPLAAGAPLDYSGSLAAFRFIAQGVAPGVLDVSFY